MCYGAQGLNASSERFQGVDEDGGSRPGASLTQTKVVAARDNHPAVSPNASVSGPGTSGVGVTVLALSNTGEPSTTEEDYPSVQVGLPSVPSVSWVIRPASPNSDSFTAPTFLL